MLLCFTRHHHRHHLNSATLLPCPQCRRSPLVPACRVSCDVSLSEQGLYGVALAYVTSVTAHSISISCSGHSDADAESQGCDPIAWVQAVSGHATTHEQPQDELYRIDRVEKGSVMAYSRSSVVNLCSSALAFKWRRLLVQSPSPAPLFASSSSSPPLPPGANINPAQASAISLCLAAQDYCLVLKHPHAT